jgi:hypothetical protein
MNCRCGGTLYQCTKCSATWCNRRDCSAGNGNPQPNAINKCPRCNGYGNTTSKRCLPPSEVGHPHILTIQAAHDDKDSSSQTTPMSTSGDDPAAEIVSGT